MCHPMATSSIWDAAVPNRRAVHICMNGRSRVRSEKLGGEAETVAGEAAEGDTGAGPDIRSRISEAA